MAIWRVLTTFQTQLFFPPRGTWTCGRPYRSWGFAEKLQIWWVVEPPTPLKNMSQFGWFFPIYYGKNMFEPPINLMYSQDMESHKIDVPNHQPALYLMVKKIRVSGCEFPFNQSNDHCSFKLLGVNQWSTWIKAPTSSKATTSLFAKHALLKPCK